MKVFIMSILLLCLSAIASENTASKLEIKEGQVRAQAETIQYLLKELKLEKSHQSIAKSLKHDCDDEDPRVQCVQQCSVRGATGTCLSYGSDYCGVDASCSENCTVRGATGTCLSYGSDHCGPNAFCVENCTVRGATGTCLSYGSDICY